MAGINTQTSGRGVAEVEWDADKYQGDVTIVATNPATGEVSNKTGPNDGSMTFTYPEDHSGETEFKISDEFGNEEVLDATVDDGVVTSFLPRDSGEDDGPQNSTSGETEDVDDNDDDDDGA